MLRTGSELLKFPRPILYGYAKMATNTDREIVTDINGQTINYLKVGEGQKNLLLFPGSLGSIWTDFKPQVEGLDRTKFTIVAWDPPGHGFSRPPDKKFHSKYYETDADVAHQLMHKLGLKKYSLLGWSDGGLSSIFLAVKHPQIVEKLVIWGSNAYILPEEAEIYKKMSDTSNWSERTRAPLEALYTEKGFKEMIGRWVNAQLEIEKNGGDICKACLSKIQCPTFIMHGDKDSLIAPEHPGYLFDNIKHAKLHRFPDGKHNIHLKFAEKFNQLVTEFLAL